MTIRLAPHSPLIIDVAGLQLSATDRRRLVHPLVGGIILFARNWVDRAQLLQLTSSIKAVPGVVEVSIGHALIADALELGYAATVEAYRAVIERAFIDRALMDRAPGADR